MLFLHISNQDSLDRNVPKSFMEEFAPVWERIAKDDLADSCPKRAFLENEIRLGEGFAHCRFTIDNPPPNAMRLKQTHSDVIWKTGEVQADSRGDGLLTTRYLKEREPPLTLSIQTADCLAIAFVCRTEEILIAAAVHAGWRGYTAGIHLRAMERMMSEARLHGISGEHVLAQTEVVISPAIHGTSYECGDDVARAIAHHRQSEVCHLPFFADVEQVYTACQDIKLQFDTAKGRANLFQQEKIYPDFQLLACCDLLALGVDRSRLTVFRENTFANEFIPSYRYATLHRGDTSRRLFTNLTLEADVLPE